jgi:hypothetical protein
MSINPIENFTTPLVKEVAKLTGGVKRIMALPCSLPVEVYVETLVPAVLGAWYSIIEPDPKEIYHKVSGKSFICDVTSSAEGAARMAGVPENKATRFLFKSAAVYDIATWYFFLGDVVAEGLANWTSFAYAQRQCNAKGSPDYGSGPAYAGALAGGQPNSNTSYVFSPPSKFAPVSTTEVIAMPGKSVTLACSASFKAGPVTVAVQSWIGPIDDYSIRMDFDDNDNGDGTATGTSKVWTKFKNPTSEMMTLGLTCVWNGPHDAQVFIDTDVSHCSKAD